MTSTRKHYGPGVGGRTGMRVDEDVRSISGYLQAGRRAMDEHDDEGYDDETSYNDTTRQMSRADETALYASSSSPRSIARSRRSGPSGSSYISGRGDADQIPGSSSMAAMDLENSYAPSPVSRSSRRGLDDSLSMSRPVQRDDQDDSMVDYGSGAEDNYGDDDPAGRSATSIGQNRGRASGVSQYDNSRRRSDFDLSESAPYYGDDNDDAPPMDMNAGDMPSFNVDDSGDRDEGDVSGEEVERFVDAGLDVGADDDENLPEVIEDEDEELRVMEDEQQALDAGIKRKRGRPPKGALDATGKRLPVDLRGKVISERVISTRGRAGSVMDGDVRRSLRHRYAPLEYWRGERAIYGRPSSAASRDRRRRRPDSAEGEEEGDDAAEEAPNADDTVDENVFEDAPVKTFGGPVPSLREIIRVPRGLNEGTFTGMKIARKKAAGAAGAGPGRPPKKRGRKRKGSASDAEDEDEEPDPTAPTRNPEDGWDDSTDPHGTVWDVERQSEIERRIACPISQVRPKSATNSPFAFEKVFGVDEYMAAGILEIPVGGSKPTKPTKDNNYTFVVLEGAVDVRVHRTMFRMSPGGMFMVPKGNTYSIENCCQRRARIFFAQARQAGSKTNAAAGGSSSGNAVAAMSTPNTTADNTTRISSSSLSKNNAAKAEKSKNGGGSSSSNGRKASASQSPTKARNGAEQSKKRGRPPKNRAVAVA